jgi:hypothetical protein
VEDYKMAELNEKELVPLDINLNPETMDESYLSALGAQVELLLKHMFGFSMTPAKIRGTRSQVSSFARALGNERRYLTSFERHGLGDPRTMADRHKLERAVTAFERETGIKWPFK